MRCNNRASTARAHSPGSFSFDHLFSHIKHLEYTHVSPPAATAASASLFFHRLVSVFFWDFLGWCLGLFRGFLWWVWLPSLFIALLEGRKVEVIQCECLLLCFSEMAPGNREERGDCQMGKGQDESCSVGESWIGPA